LKDFKFWEIVLNPPLVAALAAMASSQVFKTLKPLFLGKLPDLRKLTDYGGNPSSHTAFIAACTLAAGITEGFRSSAFAVAAVIACILIYDILKLRRTVELNGRETDRLLENAGLERSARLPQFRAHTPPEVFAGVAWGFFWAALVCVLW
jgi:uncharacterized protein